MKTFTRAFFWCGSLFLAFLSKSVVAGIVALPFYVFNQSHSMVSVHTHTNGSKCVGDIKLTSYSPTVTSRGAGVSTVTHIPPYSYADFAIFLSPPDWCATSYGMRIGGEAIGASNDIASFVPISIYDYATEKKILSGFVGVTLHWTDRGASIYYHWGHNSSDYLYNFKKGNSSKKYITPSSYNVVITD